MDFHKPLAEMNAAMLIGGVPVEGEVRLQVRNPANPDELVGTVVRGTPEHVNGAVAAAKAAQIEWAQRTFTERAAVLSRVLDRISEGVDERANLYVRENGKTLSEARAELTDVAIRARFTLELAAELDVVRSLPASNGRTVITPVPYGVVVSIAPWNGPVSLAAMQIIPALLAGNAVVLKPPESCPLTLIQTAELMARELPAGLLNIVTGLPSEIGDALITHPDVGKIGFTGSVASARKIICLAATGIKPVNAELGGNDAAIVLEDADLRPAAMERMATSVFRMAGQVCMAIKRIYVPASRHDDFVEAFTRAVDKIAVGDGRDPAVTMGPLHTRAALLRGVELVADAEARGAKVRRLGRIQDPTMFERGYFMHPTIVTGVVDEDRLMTEEQFCPAIPIATYNSVDDALARANATDFGLGGSVWGQDIGQAMRVAQKLRAGTVFVNAHGTNNVNRKAPYGGVKQSGGGRRAGHEGLQEYYQLQTLTTFEPPDLIPSF